ncbi:CoA-transferase family III [Pyrenochaeta sp. DS3sAY3a]|nr:CoA-transferase family III [Pyrenochaeta sp. DS3sAY3a]
MPHQLRTVTRTTHFTRQKVTANARLFLVRHSSTTFGGGLDDKIQGPLAGIKVLDLSRVLAAPYCTQILADYGANVIKVEAIGKGDDTRHWRMIGENAAWRKSAGPISNYFSAINRNKKSITLDLKKPEGREILLRLVKTADVIIENFKPGTMERLNIGYEQLKQVNPEIIYASISGYGTTGPYAKRGGYDPIAGAEAGLLHVTGERNGPPVRPGLGMIDMATGLYMHGAIMAALYARKNGAKGQRVDASLFETQISLLVNVGLSWLNLGIEAERWGCQHPSIAPYDAFKTKDSYLVCGATNDAQFSSLCKLIGIPALIKDERFATNPKRVENREALAQIFNQAFEGKTTSDWTEKFEGTGLPFGPINNMEKTFAHPQTVARDMVTEVPSDSTETGYIKLIGPAVKFSETKTKIANEPPKLGQHTVEVLAGLGFSDSDVESFRKTGVV